MLRHVRQLPFTSRCQPLASSTRPSLAVVAVHRARSKDVQEVMVVMVEEEQVLVTPSHQVHNNLIRD